MAEYTVTEALVKLKNTKKKIEDATNLTLVGMLGTKGSNVAPAGFKNVDEFKSEISKRLDSVTGLIAFRDSLKKAIVESNARTPVVVGSKTMTVAEAIETKNSIESKKVLLNKLVHTWTTLESQANQKNAQLETQANNFVAQMFGQNTAATEEQKAEARKNFLQSNTAVIVTGDNVRNYIEKLKQEIEDFETNVDVALSVVNATTKVNVEA